MSGAICMALRALDRIDRDNHVERKPITILHTTSEDGEEPALDDREPAGVGAKIRSLLGR
ncbi:MAG: hypothetical protein F4Y88_07955 [Chloroflexi bacterium]|nr:hypothetical protein [Chloroflexota bacterium]